jgi:hypothetical protein
VEQDGIAAAVVAAHIAVAEDRTLLAVEDTPAEAAAQAAEPAIAVPATRRTISLQQVSGTVVRT